MLQKRFNAHIHDNYNGIKSILTCTTATCICECIYGSSQNVQMPTGRGDPEMWNDMPPNRNIQVPDVIPYHGKSFLMHKYDYI